MTSDDILGVFETNCRPSGLKLTCKLIHEQKPDFLTRHDTLLLQGRGLENAFGLAAVDGAEHVKWVQLPFLRRH